ncbi:hypothetical protein D3C81_1123950 [compost metagenome]
MLPARTVVLRQQVQAERAPGGHAPFSQCDDTQQRFVISVGLDGRPVLAAIDRAQQRAAMTDDNADLRIGESHAGECPRSRRAHGVPGLSVLVGDQYDATLADGNKVLAAGGDVEQQDVVGADLIIESGRLGVHGGGQQTHAHTRQKIQVT